MPTIQVLQDVQTRLERGEEEGQKESKEGGMREGGRNVLLYNNTSECMHIASEREQAVRMRAWFTRRSKFR